MKKFLTILIVALALCGLAGNAQARELPSCKNAIAHLAEVIRPSFIVELFEINSIDGQYLNTSTKRWCYTYFSSQHLANGVYRMGSPWQEAIYYFEWENEEKGSYWLKIIRQREHRKYGDERDYQKIEINQ